MSNGIDQAQPPPESTANQVESESRKRASPGDDSWLPEMSNGTDQAQPTPENTANQVDSKSQGAAPGDDSWLPEMLNGTDQAQPPPENTANQVDSKSPKRASPGDDSWLPDMSNGTDQAKPPPENKANQVDSKSRKRASPGDDSWLPRDWRTEVKVRTSGTKAGIVDKFYYEPVTGLKFRSKNEVMYYLEHGTPKKKNKKAEKGDLHSEPSEGKKRKTKYNKKAKMPNFDFVNVPEKVTWMGTNGSEEAWWPFIGDYKIEESVSQDWDRAFTLVTTQNAGKPTF